MSAEAVETGAAPVIAVVGESHSAPFVGAFVRAAATGRILAVASVVNLPGLTAEQFLDEHGRIGGRIVDALSTQRLLTRVYHDEVRPYSFISHDLIDAQPGTSWIAEPLMTGSPLLFIVGEMNVRKTYLAIPPLADVPVPFRPEALARVPPFEPNAIVAPESVQATIETQLEPLFRALAILRSVGIGPIALSSISPVSPDDVLIRALLGGDSQAMTRTKVAMLFNAALRRRCAREGFHFIDRWDDFTDGGVVRDGFLVDLVHIGDRMRESLGILYRETLGARAPENPSGRFVDWSPRYNKGYASDAVAAGRHREILGGGWDELGTLQMEFLQAQGLRPEQYVLDVGCGCLRAGVRLVEYLDPDHYYGTDRSQALLDVGYDVELRALGGQLKLSRDHLVCDDSFDFAWVPVRFEFAFAHSVFVHLPLRFLRRCLERLWAAMAPGGVFYASFFEVPEAHTSGVPFAQPLAGIQTYGHRNPYHFRASDVMASCAALPWRAVWIGDYGHPGGQRMVKFEALPES